MTLNVIQHSVDSVQQTSDYETTRSVFQSNDPIVKKILICMSNLLYSVGGCLDIFDDPFLATILSGSGRSDVVVDRSMRSTLFTTTQHQRFFNNYAKQFLVTENFAFLVIPRNQAELAVQRLIKFTRAVESTSTLCVDEQTRRFRVLQSWYKNSHCFSHIQRRWICLYDFCRAPWQFLFLSYMTYELCHPMVFP